MDYAKLAIKKNASYAEILKTKFSTTSIETNNKQVKQFSTGERNIYAVRLLYKGSWGLAYSSKPGYPDLVMAAIKNAKSLRQKIKIKDANPVRSLIDTEYTVDPAEIGIEEKKTLLTSLDVRRGHPKIKSLRINYADNTVESQFENSEGSSITRKEVTIGLFSTAYAKEGKRIEHYMDLLRKRSGYELMSDAEKTVQQSMDKAEKMLKARYAKGGVSTAILDQYLAGVFAHEAVGHACEADHILTNNSVLIGKLNQKIGNDNVTIFDDGNMNEWGYTPVDSEGAKANHTVLIKKGVLNSYLHNRETAHLLKSGLTGNGRSQQPGMRVIPRMTNTVIAEGDSSFEEMLQDMKKGYYLKGSSGGQVDPAGGDFLFNAKEGYYVEKGKIKHMIKDVSLLGSIIETLYNIQLAAKDTKCDTGYCGKAGQAVPVSCGSPHVLLKNAKIGGAK